MNKPCPKCGDALHDDYPLQEGSHLTWYWLCGSSQGVTGGEQIDQSLECQLEEVTTERDRLKAIVALAEEYQDNSQIVTGGIEPGSAEYKALWDLDTELEQAILSLQTERL